MKRFSCLCVALSFLFAAKALAYGEITILPSYYFRAKQFDISRIGLYVQEELQAQWYYSSWTGSGKVYLNDPTRDNVLWFSTQQDLNYVYNGWLKLGGGFGVGYTHPSKQSDVDLHLKVAVQVW